MLNSAVSVFESNPADSLIPGAEGRGNVDVDVRAWAEIQDITEDDIRSNPV